MSKQLAALKNNHPDKVADAYVEQAGTDDQLVWIELKPGWTADPGDGHDVCASTISEALSRFREVQPCACAQCRTLLAK